MSDAGVAYYLGIDGGQSSTRGVVLRSDGEVHGRSTAGPVPHVLAEGGVERLRDVLKEAVHGALGGVTVPIRSAFLGLSGVVPGGRLEAAVRAAVGDLLDNADVSVDNDGIVAWAGALGLAPGLIAVAGTGSLVLGVDSQANTARAGGWGYVFGDEPGAFGIARDVIRRALRQVDRGHPPNQLSEAIVAHFAGCKLEDVPRAFYNDDFDRAHVARLLPRLVTLANEGWPEARETFAAAAVVLAEQMRAVASRLTWASTEVPWAPVGGVFAAGAVFGQPLDAALARDPTYRFVRVTPLADPVIGAAWLAADRVGDPRPANPTVHGHS